MELSVSSQLTQIEPQCGVSFRLSAGDVLHVLAVASEQVADLALFNAADIRDAFSPGRTIDYNERITLRPGDALFSQRSTRLAEVVDDTVGVHDMLLTPCSRVMFERRGQHRHPSCHENLSTQLARFGVLSDDVSATINVFMDVRVDDAGRIALRPPPSRPGDRFSIRALCDLVIGLTACSSELTNNGSCKAVGFAVDKQPLPSLMRPCEG